MSDKAASAVRQWTLVLTCICAFMLILDLSVVAVALPSMQRSLNASLPKLQWVFDAYAVTLAAALVTSGSIADRWGRKQVFLVGILVFTLGSLACGLSQSALVLDISRAVQGLGAAILYAVGPALLGHEFHGKARANAFAAYGAATGIAAATGPLIGGALTNGPGWRWIFLMNVPIGLIIIPITLAKIRESRRADAGRSDVIGMISLTVFLGATVLAVTRGNSDGWFSTLNVLMYILAALGLIALVVGSARLGPASLFDPTLFRSRTFVGLCVATLLVNMCGFPFIFLATTYMQSVLNSSAWQAGLRFLPMTAAMFVFGGVAGEMCKRIPFRILMFVACVAVGVAALLTRLSDASHSWTALIPALIVAGAGIGVIMPVRAALSVSVLEPAKAALASGVSETFQQTGVAIGLAIGGAFFERRVIENFSASNSGRLLAGQAHQAGTAISAGALKQVANSVPQQAGQVLSDGRVAFATGFHDSMTLCAVFAAVAAIVALLMISNRQLHPSARLDGVLPDTETDTDRQPLLTQSGAHASTTA